MSSSGMKEASTNQNRSQPRIDASQESRQLDADGNAGDGGVLRNGGQENMESGSGPDTNSNKKKRKAPDSNEEPSQQQYMYGLYATIRKYQQGFVKAGMMSAPIGPDGAGVLHALAKNLSRFVLS